MKNLFSGNKKSKQVQEADQSKNMDVIFSTVEQVKTASTEIVDGVTIVRDLADENKHSANTVVGNMEELTEQNAV